MFKKINFQLVLMLLIVQSNCNFWDTFFNGESNCDQKRYKGFFPTWKQDIKCDLEKVEEIVEDVLLEPVQITETLIKDSFSTIINDSKIEENILSNSMAKIFTTIEHGIESIVNGTEIALNGTDLIEEIKLEERVIVNGITEIANGTFEEIKTLVEEEEDFLSSIFNDQRHMIAYSVLLGIILLVLFLAFFFLKKFLEFKRMIKG